MRVAVFAERQSNLNNINILDCRHRATSLRVTSFPGARKDLIVEIARPGLKIFVPLWVYETGDRNIRVAAARVSADDCAQSLEERVHLGFAAGSCACQRRFTKVFPEGGSVRRYSS